MLDRKIYYESFDNPANDNSASSFLRTDTDTWDDYRGYLAGQFDTHAFINGLIGMTTSIRHLQTDLLL
jgi:hypothetical protein